MNNNRVINPDTGKLNPQFIKFLEAGIAEARNAAAILGAASLELAAVVENIASELDEPEA